MQRIRWPKNYSLFSGSDSDLEGQGAAARRAGLHIDIPASSSAPVAPVLGIYLFCAGDQVDLSVLKTPPAGSKPARTPALGTATVSANDAVWKSSPLPISQLIGIPLLMRRLLAKPTSTTPSSPHFDNPLASQLQADPENNDSASADAARGLGTVLVVRADREPLNKELIDRICAFHSKLLNMAQQRGPGSMSQVLKTQANPQRFIDFCMESLSSPGGFGGHNSVHELLGDSWLELQRPVAAV